MCARVFGGGGEGRGEYQAYLGFGFYKNDLFLGFQINLKFFLIIGIMYDYCIDEYPKGKRNDILSVSPC